MPPQNALLSKLFYCERVAKMRNGKRGRYTLEFQQEAARLVKPGQSQAAAARTLGVVQQTLGNWVREHRAGTLKGASSKPLVRAERMENSRPRAELARLTMERDILGKATAYFAKGQKCSTPLFNATSRSGRSRRSAEFRW